MSKRIRVLLTISDLDSGGAQRQFSILVKHLSRKRFEPHLCFWRPNFRYDYPKDLPVYMLKKTRPWHVFGVIRDMRRLIEKIRPQLIYSQLHYVNMVTGSALSESRHRARWICRQPNDPFYEMKGPFAMWARKALQRADYVVGPSKGVSLAIEKHLKIDPKKIKTIYNVVDVEQID
ncbi:MAG: glycosyltransferase, partial [Deltaproteobacteria bacterium]|nr:glycosyltransferase [Deltaproteobacteria bacterium]